MALEVLVEDDKRTSYFMGAITTQSSRHRLIMRSKNILVVAAWAIVYILYIYKPIMRT